MYNISSNLTLIPNRNLSTQVWARSVRVITQRVTLSRLRGEHQELVIRYVQPELLGDVVVVSRRLVARATGAVESGAGVDARGRDVAVVLARDGVAGPADGGLGSWVGEDEGGGCQEEGGEDGEGLHFDFFVWWCGWVGRYVVFE
jgi:hypothetical protein